MTSHVSARDQGIGEAELSGGVSRRFRDTTVSLFLRSHLAVAGLTLVLLMVLFSFVGPLFYHTNQTATDLLNARLPPGGSHLLGTDDVGHDVLGRLMVGGRSSLELGFAVAILATGIGTIWGAVAGYCGGVVDAVMMRIVDVLLSIPGLVLVIILGAMFRSTLWSLILIIAMLSWVVPARLVRGEALVIRVREFVQAVRVMGGGGGRIVCRHVVPNVLGVVVVNATFQVADAILTLATLSFLGLGLAPPATSWGDILSNGLNYLYDGYWWLVYPAGAAIVITVVGFNLLGDALRDSLDVRLRDR